MKKKPEKKIKSVKAWEIKPLTWKPVIGFPDETVAEPTNPFARPDDEDLSLWASKHTGGSCNRVVDWSWGFGGNIDARGFESMADAQAAAEVWWRDRIASLLIPVLISPIPKTKRAKRGSKARKS